MPEDLPKTNDRLVLLGDQTQTQDGLGYAPYADAMVEILAQGKLQTPFVVGVFGHWGTGKSTFMTLLDEQLDRNRRREKDQQGGFHCVWFQPWQFENKEEIWQALLLSVLSYLNSVARSLDPAEEVAQRITQTVVELTKGIGKLALNQMIGKASNDLLSFDKMVNAYSEIARDNTEFVNCFRKRFSELKDEVLDLDGSETKRLFIFVDDLDRCTPESCIVVLEAIKLFFDFPECVFVLGIDREVVQQGIRFKYKDSLKISGQSYIEKIVQLPFSLPPVREEVFEQFVKGLTGSFGFSPETVKLIVEASEQNPRRAKRLSNCLQLVRTVSKRLEDQGAAAADKLDEEKLALLLTLQIRYPVAFLWLTRNQRTFAELDDEWRGSDASTKGLRDVLTNFLSTSYGEDLAEVIADGFHGLWRKAHGSKIGVPAFADREDIGAHLRVSGLIDEGQARDAMSSRETMRDRYDRLYGDDGSDAIDLAEGAGPDEPTEPGPPPGSGHQQLAALTAEAEDLNSRISLYRKTPFAVFAFLLPVMDWRSRRLVEEFFDLIADIRRLVTTQADARLQGLESRLLHLAPSRLRRTVKLVARSCTGLSLFLVMLAGTAVEEVLRYLRPAAENAIASDTATAEAVPVSSDYLERIVSNDMTAFGGVSTKNGILEVVWELIWYFPGGPVAFICASVLFLYLFFLSSFAAQDEAHVELAMRRLDGEEA